MPTIASNVKVLTPSASLRAMSREELAFRRIDKKSINEISAKLADSGYHLEDEEE